MLPRDLLVVFKRRGKIKPKYLNDNDFHTVQELIEIFREHKGRKYRELQQRLEEIEDLYGCDYKVIRGLSTLLERVCEFESSSSLSGWEIRRFLFDRGFVLNDVDRKRVMTLAGRYFNATPQEIEEAMFSDLREEQILKGVYSISPRELIKRYNLSLTQTLLFDALELSFRISGNYQEVFRQIKYLGLMYEIEDEGENKDEDENGSEIKITGPAAIFKKTRKYGVAMARLIPFIMRANEWSIRAKIEYRRDNRIYDFELTSHDDVPLPEYSEPVEHFDSEVEERFYNEFKSLNTGWEIRREPTVIKTGSYVIIPDFGFYKNGMKHYMEVVGFWTPEYLKKKIWKLKNADVSITVAVNEDLRCKKEDFSGDVVFYKNRIPLKPIVKILNRIEEGKIQKEMDMVGEIKIEMEEDIVLLKEKAEELGISEATLKRTLKRKISNYFVVGDKIVSKKLLERVKSEIGREKEYEEVEKILSKYGLTTEALDYMGYKTVWEGLKPKKVVMREVQ